MNRTLMLIIIATLTAFGQKIEMQKPDRNKITRLGTTQNHLSVIELGEPVTQVAAGSSSFKIEWRENKVFIQPLEPGATRGTRCRNRHHRRRNRGHQSRGLDPRHPQAPQVTLLPRNRINHTKGSTS